MIYRYTRFTAVLLMLIASTGCDKEEKNHNISVLDTSYKEIADKTNRNHSECIPDTEICFTEQEISTAVLLGFFGKAKEIISSFALVDTPN